MSLEVSANEMVPLQHDKDGQQRPITKLPLFNTTTRAGSDSSYHEVKAPCVNVVIGSENICQRFALFLAAITGEREIAFVAGTKAETGLVIFNAEISEDNVHLNEIPCVDVQTGMSGLDFGIFLRHEHCHDTERASGSSLAQPRLPFELHVVLDSQQKRMADITLRLRTDYGPLMASQHLLNLALSHIIPNGELAQMEGSQITGPVIGNGSDASNLLLSSVLEQTVRSHPADIAIEEVTGRSGSVYSCRSVTYSELDDLASLWANQITSVLDKLNWPLFCGEQRMVPIYLPNCTELSICMNGILRAGHCFCSLPIDAPPERLRSFLDDLGAPGILGIGTNPWAGTEFGKEITWINFRDPTTCLVDTEPHTLKELSSGTQRTARSNDVAYIIYTSGSTGKPKGVVLRHSTAMAFLKAFDGSPNSLPCGPSLRWMNMSSPTFDMMLMDHFMPFLKGGTVTIAERSLLLSNPEAVITELRATATLMVPSLAMLLRPERMPTLNTLYVGGELVPQRILDSFVTQHKKNGPRRRLFGAYGPTETTVMASLGAYSGDSRPSIIGSPLPGVQYIILEMNVAPSRSPRAVPFGAVGELAIGGPQLSTGYLNRAAETELAFIDSTLYGKLYRTGDKARVVWSEQGVPVIDFLGRVNMEQVKLNGRRVELPEIENVLAKVDNVALAAAFVSESKLLACIMPRDGISHVVLEAECRSVAARYLPAWMQPLQYVFTEALPRNTSGKVDRQALQAIVLTRKSLPADTEALGLLEGYQPDYKSIVYRGLAAALGARIREQDISVSLVSLGLDSLRALVFIQELEEWGVEHLDIQVVLVATTIGDLIVAVESHQAPGLRASQEMNGVHETCAPKEQNNCIDKVSKPALASDTIALKPGDANSNSKINVSAIGANSDDVFNLSLEEKLYHFDHHCRVLCLEALQLSDNQIEQVLPVTNVQARFVAAAVDPTINDPTRYTGRPNVNHFPYLVPEDMDPARLQRAVETVLPRYDCFRTVFVPVSHSLAPFAQCILSPSVAVIPKVEVVCCYSGPGIKDSSSLWQQTINGVQRAAEASMSIDRPGITVSWVWSQNKSRCVFVLSLFHGIYDGVQLVYLRDAIAAEYARPGSEQQQQLLPISTAVKLGLSYDWVGTVMYWARRLGGIPGFQTGSRQPVPSILLPASAPGVEESHMRILRVKSTKTMYELDQAAVRMSTTMLTVVEAAWASVLAQTLPRENITSGLFNIQFGTVMNGRRHHEALRCMAPMIAALPVLLEFGGSSIQTRSNRETCALLSAQRIEAEPYLQMPCPTIAHAKMGTDRIDSVLLVQALQHDGASAQGRTSGLPGYNVEENLLPAWKEGDSGWPILTEVLPGRGRWDEKMQLQCTFNVSRPGYQFLARDWIAAALSAMDEAINRITTQPDAPFYLG